MQYFVTFNFLCEWLCFTFWQFLTAELLLVASSTGTVQVCRYQSNTQVGSAHFYRLRPVLSFSHFVSNTGTSEYIYMYVHPTKIKLFLTSSVTLLCSMEKQSVGDPFLLATTSMYKIIYFIEIVSCFHIIWLCFCSSCPAKLCPWATALFIIRTTYRYTYNLSYKPMVYSSINMPMIYRYMLILTWTILH